ncbi:MAG TPA: lysophospholipid acyltransferase family protein [Geminicoccaceae bacterium]|nr:lysophospholipid acyltransferase family protein [Geminicoccus sp.]HMU51232.1 lysophospholipid acyltransferase family protein [Geminicoccaceae bacterium]
MRLPSPPEPVAHRIARRLGNAFDLAFIYAFLLLFAVMSLLWSLVGALGTLLLPARVRQRIGPRLVHHVAGWYLGLLASTGRVRFDLAELDALDAEGGLVIVPNHPSMLDAVMFISRLPRLVCIAKAELWDNPLLGGGMRMAGYIRNDAPIKLVKLAAERLRQGQQLLLFPEGTRTSRPPVSEFRSGFALMAKMADVPVQTVFIETNTPFLGKGWSLLRRPDFPLLYRVRVGRRFRVEGETKRFVADLERYFRDELQRSAA